MEPLLTYFTFKSHNLGPIPCWHRLCQSHQTGVTVLNILLNIHFVNYTWLYPFMLWPSLCLTHNPRNDNSLFSICLSAPTDRWIAFILPLKVSYCHAFLSCEREEHELVQSANASFLCKNLFNGRQRCQKNMSVCCAMSKKAREERNSNSGEFGSTKLEYWLLWNLEKLLKI